jgi:hypothetical protein
MRPFVYVATALNHTKLPVKLATKSVSVSGLVVYVVPAMSNQSDPAGEVANEACILTVPEKSVTE